MITEQELLRKKKKVDDAKVNIATLKGQVQAHEKQLKSEWGYKTVEEATKGNKERNKKIEEYSQQIEEGCVELEKYDLEED